MVPADREQQPIISDVPFCVAIISDVPFCVAVYLSDYAKAEQAFRTAIKLGAGVDSYCGLARVLAQAGEPNKAVQNLSEGVCPFHSDNEVQKMRAEIIAGDWS